MENHRCLFLLSGGIWNIATFPWLGLVFPGLQPYNKRTDKSSFQFLFLRQQFLLEGGQFALQTGLFFLHTLYRVSHFIFLGTQKRGYPLGIFILDLVIQKRSVPAEHADAFSAFILDHAYQLDQPNLPSPLHMWRAAGAHIVSWYRQDPDLAVNFNLAAVIEFF